jgi:hypothetical protein
MAHLSSEIGVNAKNTPLAASQARQLALTPTPGTEAAFAAENWRKRQECCLVLATLPRRNLLGDPKGKNDDVQA